MAPYVPSPWDILCKQYVGRRLKMKYFLVIVTSLFVLISLGWAMQGGSDATAPAAQETEKSSAATPASAPASSATTRVYPIAPGVWYPGQGPIPEKPVRYYRARCWPGCHRGSTHGMYPDKPLNMEPIFPTSTIDLEPDMPAKK
jgi:hypothetical protein